MKKLGKTERTLSTSPPPNPGGVPNPGEVHDATATHSPRRKMCMTQGFAGFGGQNHAVAQAHLQAHSCVTAVLWLLLHNLFVPGSIAVFLKTIPLCKIVM
jgi:hypothetical protein